MKHNRFKWRQHFCNTLGKRVRFQGMGYCPHCGGRLWGFKGRVKRLRPGRLTTVGRKP